MTVNNQHGGDLEVIERKYNIPKENLINFSGNVNPLGVPESIKEAIIKNVDCICRYPDVSYLSLRTNIGEYINISPENIIPGNGATELISLFIKTVSPKRALIVSPSYSEYEREIKLNGGKVNLYPLKESNAFKLDINNLINFLSDDTELVILCNPNNPTGSAININETETLLKYCSEKNIYVMIDETYVEFTDDDRKISAMPLVPNYGNLFIIRGTAKFFACPGLRLGYGVCSNIKITERINTLKDPWSVNIYAAAAGEVMFKDTDFIKKTKELIKNERAKIIKELKTWTNIKLYEPEANFILIKLLNKNIKSQQIFKSLIKDNLIIRDASDFVFLGDSYLRFCVLSPNQNKLLISKLKNIL